MSLNNTAAVEVLLLKKPEIEGFTPNAIQWVDAQGNLYEIEPDSNYTDAMLVRDKAVERYAEWIEEPGVSKDACIANARENFVKELGGLDMHRTSLVFASPAQITEASIALVRRMK